ncbi:MAG: bestrophin-like domain [Mycobacteriaceae bacterium]
MSDKRLLVHASTTSMTTGSQPMDRWLLTHLADWQLFILFIGGGEVLALGGLLLYRRLIRPTTTEHNEILGVALSLVIGVYGILLAFVIVTLWTSYDAAKNNVAAEATSLAQISRDYTSFPAKDQRLINGAIKIYIQDLDKRAWPAMADGKDPGSGALTTIYTAVGEIRPVGPSQIAWNEEAARDAGALAQENRMRITQSQESIPGLLRLLALVGAVLLTVCTYLLGIRSRQMHLFVVAVVTCILSLSLLLALDLEYPYSGNIHITSNEFHTGELEMIGGR